jgi:hypothetical protein
MTTDRVALAAAVILVAVTWITFAEHPTARNLRNALIATTGL